MAQNICPVCGGPLLSNCYDLQDGTVCGKCAEDLRFQYPLIHQSYVGVGKPDYSRIPQCEGLDSTSLKILRKNTKKYTCYGKSGKTKYVFRIDLMCLLTVEEFRARIKEADACENKIRMQYLDYTNVFVVDYARPLSRPVGKEGLQNIRKRKTGYCITGYIKAAAFRDGEMVGILHKGKLRHADIICLGHEPYAKDEEEEMRTRAAETLGDAGDLGHQIRAGHQVTMVLNDKAAGVEAGDWIVTDG